VIPRTYCRTLLDAEPEVVKRCIAVVQLIAGPIASYCGADAFTVLSNNGRQAGQMVDYLHWHVIPRCEGDAVSLYSPGPAANQAELAKLAEQLRGAIANHHFVHRDGTT
jgi:histidine triad (HIT) family protein